MVGEWDGRGLDWIRKRYCPSTHAAQHQPTILQTTTSELKEGGGGGILSEVVVETGWHV